MTSIVQNNHDVVVTPPSTTTTAAATTACIALPYENQENCAWWLNLWCKQGNIVRVRAWLARHFPTTTFVVFEKQHSKLSDVIQYRRKTRSRTRLARQCACCLRNKTKTIYSWIRIAAIHAMQHSHTKIIQLFAMKKYITHETIWLWESKTTLVDMVVREKLNRDMIRHLLRKPNPKEIENRHCHNNRYKVTDFFRYNTTVPFTIVEWCEKLLYEACLLLNFPVVVMMMEEYGIGHSLDVAGLLSVVAMAGLVHFEPCPFRNGLMIHLEKSCMYCFYQVDLLNRHCSCVLDKPWSYNHDKSTFQLLRPNTSVTCEWNIKNTCFTAPYLCCENSRCSCDKRCFEIPLKKGVDDNDDNDQDDKMNNPKSETVVGSAWWPFESMHEKYLQQRKQRDSLRIMEYLLSTVTRHSLNHINSCISTFSEAVKIVCGECAFQGQYEHVEMLICFVKKELSNLQVIAQDAQICASLSVHNRVSMMKYLLAQINGTYGCHPYHMLLFKKHLQTMNYDNLKFSISSQCTHVNPDRVFSISQPVMLTTKCVDLIQEYNEQHMCPLLPCNHSHDSTKNFRYRSYQIDHVFSDVTKNRMAFLKLIEFFLSTRQIDVHYMDDELLYQSVIYCHDCRTFHIQSDLARILVKYGADCAMLSKEAQTVLMQQFLHEDMLILGDVVNVLMEYCFVDPVVSQLCESSVASQMYNTSNRSEIRCPEIGCPTKENVSSEKEKQVIKEENASETSLENNTSNGRRILNLGNAFAVMVLEQIVGRQLLVDWNEMRNIKHLEEE